ncbi:MAG: hypothetical protein RLZZ347_577 [Candidatus Parcubacteria bacterium]
MDTLLRAVEKIIPKSVYAFFQPIYHYSMALLGAIVYRFPSRKITVLAVTGTKGKSTTTEILSTLLEQAGFKTAVSNTVRFKIDTESTDNKYKMSMPGRFFMQHFLHRAVTAGCQYAVIETTSEGARFFRHRFIALDGLIFTNLSPEHIESHGSFEKYRDAKLSIARTLKNSSKKRKVLVINEDESESSHFKALGIIETIGFSKNAIQNLSLGTHGSSFTYKNTQIQTHLSGLFNIYNILGAIKMAEAFGIGLPTIQKAVANFRGVRGRVERVSIGEKQTFDVIVDYAHTTDSLSKLYETFQESRKICVLGSTGGGRDKWKRKEMGAIAEKFCDDIILTNEDPYDEDPMKIIEDVQAGVTEKQAQVIVDRREAIRTAISLAGTGDTVLITGKGTDPYIMGPNNTKLPWDDATVTREELTKLFKKDQ